MSTTATNRRRVNPWVVMTIVHATALAITIVLFAIAIVSAETVVGPHAREIVAAWVMAGVVLAPLITGLTALWWVTGKKKEELPAHAETGPYADLPERVSGMRRAAA